MASKPKSTGKAEGDLEIVSDAWERFERAVDTVIKSGPKHRTKGVVKTRTKRTTAGGKAVGDSL
jgi:hypothetical protein